MIKQINCVHINIFENKGCWFKIRMEFLRPILVKILLIWQQPAMTQPTGVMWVLVPAVGCWIGWLGADAVFWVCLTLREFPFEPIPIEGRNIIEVQVLADNLAKGCKMWHLCRCLGYIANWNEDSDPYFIYTVNADLWTKCQLTNTTLMIAKRNLFQFMTSTPKWLEASFLFFYHLLVISCVLSKWDSIDI